MCTTNLSFVNRHRAAGGVAAERCIFLPYPEPAFELWAGIMERSDAEGGGLTGYLEFEAEKYGGGRAEAIVRRLQAVLARAAAAPGDLPLEEPATADNVESRVARAARDALRLGEGEALGPEESLWARGLSSLGAVGLSAQLESELGVELPPTLAFDFVSVRALARFVAARLPPQKAQPAAVAAVPPQPSIDPGKPKPPETQALLPRMLAPAFAADEEEPSMLLQVPPPALPQRAAAFPPLSPPPPPPPPPTSLPPQPESAGALLSGASPLAALQGAVQGAVRDALWGVEVDYKTPLMARHLFFP